MGQADEFRKRAARLFALALQASERGDEAFAVEIAGAANIALEHAEKLERGAKILPPSPIEGGSQHVVQQQQQPKPEPDKE